MFELLDYSFFRNALLGVLLLSIGAGILGSYIVTRRMVSISGGITHACFGGLGLGYYMGISPIFTAALFAIGAALGVQWLSWRDKVREDSAIAVMWAAGMAIGVLFVFLTPGAVPELNSFLFGNILTITGADLWAFGGFTAALVTFFMVCFNQIVAVAFDPAFARVSGMRVKALSTAMTIFIAVGIVLMIRCVGIMLLMSMLTLPQLTAEIFCKRFRSMIFGSIAVSVVGCMGGLFASTVVDVPASAFIVFIQAAIYAVAALSHKLFIR